MRVGLVSHESDVRVRVRVGMSVVRSVGIQACILVGKSTWVDVGVL